MFGSSIATLQPVQKVIIVPNRKEKKKKSHVCGVLLTCRSSVTRAHLHPVYTIKLNKDKTASPDMSGQHQLLSDQKLLANKPRQRGDKPTSKHCRASVISLLARNPYVCISLGSCLGQFPHLIASGQVILRWSRWYFKAEFQCQNADFPYDGWFVSRQTLFAFTVPRDTEARIRGHLVSWLWGSN